MPSFFFFMAVGFRGGAEPDELDTIEDPECSSKVPTTSTSKSRHYYLKKIFVQFDCEGDLLELLNDNSTDLIKHERARRAELQARHMETAEYLRYTEARQVSMFARTNPRRLRDHFCSGQFTNFRPSPLVLEILTFAAQEIIAIIMDAVHTLRRETNLSRRSLGHLMLKPTSNSLDSKLTSKFTTSSSKSKEVSMMLAQSIRQKRKFEESQQAETSVQPVAMGLDISQNIAVKPEEIAEAVRRLTQHRVAGGPRQLFGFIASPSKLRII